MTVTVYLRKLSARSLCTIFFLRMESNALEKSTNNSVASKYLARTSMFQRIFRICNFSEKCSDFSNGLSQFQVRCDCDVVLGDSEVNFLREKEDAAFCLSLYCILFIYGVAISKL